MKPVKLAAIVSAALLLGALALAQEPLQSGIDKANFDSSVPASQDFFEHVNGTWVKSNPIPPDMSRWGSFMELHEKDLTELRQILESLSSSGSLDEDQRKLRDFYSTAMDEAKLNREGASPLKEQLDRIAALHSPQ